MLLYIESRIGHSDFVFSIDKGWKRSVMGFKPFKIEMPRIIQSSELELKNKNLWIFDFYLTFMRDENHVIAWVILQCFIMLCPEALLKLKYQHCKKSSSKILIKNVKINKKDTRKTRLISPPLRVFDFENKSCLWVDLLKRFILIRKKIKILNLLIPRPFVREHHILKCWADEKSQNAVRHQTYTALLYCIRDGKKPTLHCLKLR